MYRSGVGEACVRWVVRWRAMEEARVVARRFPREGVPFRAEAVECPFFCVALLDLEVLFAFFFAAAAYVGAKQNSALSRRAKYLFRKSPY